MRALKRYQTFFLLLLLGMAALPACNSGGSGTNPVAPGKTRIATNTLHLSDKHPSRIVLPVYQDNATP